MSVKKDFLESDWLAFELPTDQMPAMKIVFT